MRRILRQSRYLHSQDFEPLATVARRICRILRRTRRQYLSRRRILRQSGAFQLLPRRLLIFAEKVVDQIAADVERRLTWIKLASHALETTFADSFLAYN